MTGFTQKLRSKIVLRIAALATAGMAVSGCTYDVGLGYASDGYGYGRGSGYYDCDPYSPFDNYYDCDNGYGYSNIGYGGGWYDNLWYPGYGFFLFDNYGQRYNMRDSHRRYWGERRYRWYREYRGRQDGGARRDGRNYSDGGMNAIGWPERSGGRVRDDERRERNRGDGRRGRNRGWDGGAGNAVPLPDSEVVVPEPGRGQDYGRRRRGNAGTENAIPQPQRERPATGLRQGGRDDDARVYRQQPSPQSSGETRATAYEPPGNTGEDGEGQQTPRFRASEGVIERPN